MDCKHDVNFLMGTADGIVCRKCGKAFPSLATLHADLEADRAAQNAPAPVAQAEPKAPQDKPKAPRTRKKKEE